FYTVDVTETFDVLLYIDGFGVGTDAEQLQLLKRINGWLNEEGVALIDVYQPKYWQKIAGQEMTPFPDSGVRRKYDYDWKNQRMTDTWWEEESPAAHFTQSLACYTPDEIHALCQEANLAIVG